VSESLDLCSARSRLRFLVGRQDLEVRSRTRSITPPDFSFRSALRARERGGALGRQVSWAIVAVNWCAIPVPAAITRQADARGRSTCFQPSSYMIAARQEDDRHGPL